MVQVAHHSRIVGLAALLLVGLGTLADAAVPSLTRIAPRGGQRGQTVSLVLTGTGVGRGNPRLFTDLPGKAVKIHPRSNDEVEATLELPGDAPLGAYAIAVQTDSGLTSALAFAVSDLATTPEVEPNDDPATAQELKPPFLLEGQTAGTDRDFIRLPLKKGETIVVEVEARRLGSGLDPVLTLFDESNRQLAGEPESRLLPSGDRTLSFSAPADATYRLVINDLSFAPSGEPFYRLRVAPAVDFEAIYPLGWARGSNVRVAWLSPGREPAFVDVATSVSADQVAVSVPPPADAGPGARPARLVLSDRPEVLEPDSAGPYPLALGTVANGRLQQPGEVDTFTLTVTPGSNLMVQLDAATLGSPLDAVVTLSRPDGTNLAQFDDGNGLDPRQPFAVPGDVRELRVGVSDLLGRGSPAFAYRLLLRELRPDFSLSVNTPAITVPRGSVVVVPVSVSREAYSGPIQLSIPPVDGITAGGGLIAENANDGSLWLKAEPGKATTLVPLEIWGQGGPPSQPIRKRASLPTDGSSLPRFTPTQITGAIGSAAPFSITASAERLDLLHGEEARLTIKVVRPEGFKEAINLSTQGLPPQVGGGTATIAPDQSEATLVYNVDSLAPLVPAALIIAAKTKLDNVEETNTLPPVVAQVLRPYSFEVLTPKLRLAAGSKSTVTGVVRRIAPFDTPVTIAIEGSLPPGVTISEVTVAPDSTLATLTVETSAQAAPGTFPVLLRASAAMPGRKNTKDYVIPDQTVELTIEPAKQALLDVSSRTIPSLTAR